MTRSLALGAVLLLTQAVASCGGSHPTSPGRPPDVNAASGLYGLTLTVGSDCASLPEEERTRQYTARLSDDGPAKYIVTLTDATFRQDSVCIPLGCNQFRATEDGETLRFSLASADDWSGGYITEKTAAGTWLEILGLAAGPLHPTVIEASGPGKVFYCSFPGAYSCGGRTESCQSTLKYVFTRK
jgi:hypothetical protein